MTRLCVCFKNWIYNFVNFKSNVIRFEIDNFEIFFVKFDNKNFYEKNEILKCLLAHIFVRGQILIYYQATHNVNILRETKNFIHPVIFIKNISSVKFFSAHKNTTFLVGYPWYHFQFKFGNKLSPFLKQMRLCDTYCWDFMKLFRSR